MKCIICEILYYEKCTGKGEREFCLFKCNFQMACTVCDKHTTSTSFSHRHDGNHPLLSQQCWVCSVKVPALFQSWHKRWKMSVDVYDLWECLLSLCVIAGVSPQWYKAGQSTVWQKLTCTAVSLLGVSTERCSHSCAFNLSDHSEECIHCEDLLHQCVCFDGSDCVSLSMCHCMFV